MYQLVCTLSDPLDVSLLGESFTGFSVSFRAESLRCILSPDPFSVSVRFQCIRSLYCSVASRIAARIFRQSLPSRLNLNGQTVK